MKVSYCLAVSLVLVGFAQSAFARPDGYGVVVRGTVYENGMPQVRDFLYGDCDAVTARKYAFEQCLKAGAKDCRVVEVRQHQCRYKCNCEF